MSLFRSLVKPFGDKKYHFLFSGFKAVTMPQLSPEQRAMIVQLRLKGKTKAEIRRILVGKYANMARVSKSTIAIWYDRVETQFLKTGTIGRISNGKASYCFM